MIKECKEHGCDYRLDAGVLLCRSINADGTRNADWLEVAGVETKEEVAIINRLMGTSFTLSYLGRRP